MNKRRQTRRTALLLALLVLLQLTGCGRGEEITRGSFGGPAQFAQEHQQSQSEDAEEGPKEEEFHSGQPFGGSPFQPSTGSHDSASTTVMIYMVGSNLESEAGAASYDIMEMMESGVDVAKNNVIIYTGGSAYWTLDISSDYNSAIELQPDEDGDGALEGNLVGSTDEPLNMGDSATLTEFLDYTYKEYPADQYVLICWDHGGGPIFGFGADEIFDYDSLTLEEFETALKNSPFGRNNKLAWIGFDACLMSSIETASILSPYADYLVASQENEPGCGWDYSFLKTLNQTNDAEMLARSAIDSYVRTVREMRTFSFDPDVTLACLDLGKVEKVSAAMDELFGVMSGDLGEGRYSRLARIRDNTKRYGMSGVTSKGDSLDLVDLAGIARGVSQLHEREAQALLDAIEEMVVYKDGNVSDACGVSVYYPYDNQRYFLRAGKYVYETITSSEGYRTYVADFTDIWLSGSAKERVKLPGLSEGGEELTLTLTEEQLEHLSSAQYTILMEFENGDGTKAYAPIISECRVEPDENGVIRVDLDQKLLVAESGGEQLLLCVTQSAADEESVTYYGGVRLFQNATMRLNINALRKDVGISYGVKRATDEVSIKTVFTSDENLPYNGKSDISIENWHYFGYPLAALTPAYEDGALLPYSEWEEAWLSLCYIYFEDEISFSMLPASQLAPEGERLVCQIVVTDTYGNRYASDLKELETAESNYYTEKTQQGELTYQIYEDHAVLTYYKGNDTQLILPDRVQGVPVTEIKYFPFVYNSTLREIRLPGQLEAIMGNPFAGIDDLTVTLPEENRNFVIQDGMLLNGDKTVLLSVLDRSRTSLTIPEGVARVGDYAAYDMNHLQTVKLPSTLSLIGDYAFSNCPLKQLELPEGLEKIGFGAFCLDLWDYEMESNEAACTLSEVQVPASVIWIGEYAFAGLPITKFAVADGSEHFAARDAFLTDVTGTEVLAVGGGLSGTVIIPEGIQKLNADALDCCNRPGESEETLITELILPDSLQSIKGAFPSQLTGTLKRLHIGKNLSNWTGLAQQKEIEEIDISPENAFFTAVGHWVVKLAGNDTGEWAVRYAEHTENGVLSYLIYNDHAVLESYEGTDTVLELPDEVENVPVTELSSYPFDEEGRLSRLKLPAGLETIRFSPYDQRSNVTVTLDSSNPHFTVQDGMLLTKDGKKLVAVFGVTNETLTIPDTVETVGERAAAQLSDLKTVQFSQNLHIIDDGAFAGTGISTLSLPASLRTLGSYAFEGCPIQSVALPEGLETIGSRAFNNYSMQGGEFQSSPGTLTIPASVREIGWSAFAGLNIDKFTVAGGNPFFSAEGGFLVRTGDQALAAVAPGLTGSVAVPEGVFSIPRGTISHCEGITELTLPDSLVTLSDTMPWTLQRLVVGKGLAEWSERGYLSSNVEVVISADNPNFEVKDGQVVHR